MMNTLRVHLQFNHANLIKSAINTTSKSKLTSPFSASSNNVVKSKPTTHHVERSLELKPTPPLPKIRLLGGESPPLTTTSKTRMVILGAASLGVALFVMGFDDHQKALAFLPEGPLMEDFWDNMRRYALYALTVSTGAIWVLVEPIVELLKNPISAVLIIVILGGGFFLVTQVVTAMIGLSDFSYDYNY
ncbi:hypothetical protein ABFS82_13G135600 [Erythranthe guttata]|uniref:uncharacterized protein LOC105969077 n=1 Tax=Erythranthe guttata TaxID=4155 RepID=UPI00064DCD0A|nr:PREDICTED: uncharacterized protein LOC105969077 [Erythranthe guttata]|eukprot:XP_012849261.1 PREDICTED: uncharacterized protein LOC105969077 [Erythranthe guttata]